MDDPSVVFPELPTYLFAPTLGGLLSLILTVLLPIGAGLLMRQSWGTFAKGLVLLGLSGVKAYIEAWVAAEAAGVNLNHVTALYALTVNFGIALAAYFGVWKKTDIQQAALNSGLTDRD